jgi:hypothetical protein
MALQEEWPEFDDLFGASPDLKISSIEQFEMDWKESSEFGMNQPSFSAGNDQLFQ